MPFGWLPGTLMATSKCSTCARSKCSTLTLIMDWSFYAFFRSELPQSTQSGHHGLPDWAKVRTCLSAVRFPPTPGSRPVA